MPEEMMNDIAQDAELLGIFLTEAREQIETLDQGLVRLEREPDNTELIQGIFRAAHTLKGSSGAMGFREMAELTHAMEDVLDRVRNHTLQVTAEVTDALLLGLDLLREMEQRIQAGEGTGAVTQAAKAVEDLHAIAHGEVTSQANSAENSALTALPDDHVALLVNFEPDCQMTGIRAFMVLRTLGTLGTVQETRPSPEAIDQGMIGKRLLVILQSEANDEVLRQAVCNVSEVEWVRIGRGAAAAGMRLDMPAREERPATSEDAGDRTPAKSAAPVPGAGAQAQQTIRVSVEVLDRIMNLVGELVLDRTRLVQLKDIMQEHHPEDEEMLHESDSLSYHLGSIVGELHEQVLQARMLPVSQLFNRFPRMMRDICRSLGKEVDFIIEGESEQLDRSVIEKLVDPLTHILRNSVDHGMEKPDARVANGKPPRGTVLLSARREEGHVLIQVRDDGPGINAQRLRDKAIANGLVTAERAQAMSDSETYGLIFASGLSTAEQVSDVSGRGVGMDVVKRNVESLGGAIVVESDPGNGTQISLKIPLTLAIIRALIVRVGQVAMAIPLSTVEETIKVHRSQVHHVRGRGLIQWRDMVVPVVRLADAFPGCGESPEEQYLQLVPVRYSTHLVCLAVDGIMGHQEIVVKSLGDFLGEVPGLAGATILGNGRVALIIDVGRMFESGLLQQAAAGELELTLA